MNNGKYFSVHVFSTCVQYIYVHICIVYACILYSHTHTPTHKYQTIVNVSKSPKEIQTCRIAEGVREDIGCRAVTNLKITNGKIILNKDLYTHTRTYKFITTTNYVTHKHSPKRKHT